MKPVRDFILLLPILLLSACDSQTPSPGTEKTETVTRNIDIKAFNRGQKLYLQNCASCHGKQAQGTTNWQQPDEDGKYPAPPLNGTAHTWHHSPKVLLNTIKNGTGKIGGNMPAWKGRLTDQEIMDILVWIQAQWPDEIYTVWYNNFMQKQ